MRVLLTGAVGFIGSHLAERLLERGDEVRGLDNFDETLYAATIKERHLTALAASPHAAGFRLTRGDLLDETLLDALCGEHPDVVVHLAALAGVRPSLAQPKRYQRVNIEGTLNVLEACRRHRVSRLVFASSSSVYGARPRDGSAAFSERDPAVRPASPYAASKRAGELFCSNYSDLFGVATTALRFFTVYGPRQRPEMAIHKFARLIEAGQPVPLFGDGATARDYTFIDDIIDGVVAAIDRCGRRGVDMGGGGDEAPHRVYNLGGARTTPLLRLVELLEEALGKRATIDWQPPQAGDVPLTYADVSRAGAELGYAPKVPIEEGILRFVRWLRAH